MKKKTKYPLGNQYWKYSTKQLLLSILFFAFSVTLLAQEEMQEELLEEIIQEDSQSANEIALKLANPNAALGFLAVPIDFIGYDGSLPNASSQDASKINFQPSLPYPIGEGTNIFLRPLVPIVVKQPVYNGTDFENRGVDLGDIGFDLAVGKTWKSKWLTLIGIVGSIPAATASQLGAAQWTLGPEVFAGKTTNWGFFGLLINHAWGLSSQENKELSVTGGQYFYTVNLGNAWQIQAQPVYSYNSNATSGNKLTLPIGTGIAKTLILGKMPLKLSAQYWYYVESPELFGPKHQFRFSIIPVIPLPW